ncbi:MAG: hypothetical protein M1508_13315 [Nitrospirae bacterium]|nr:hypothetical protein [Nitrospirota bacterium]MCL5423032.1 hypothetical protein [Nitrospirota bacterium]
MSDKKKEAKQPEKLQPAKPMPYPLKPVDYADSPKEIITIEQSREEDV